jgi:hypothetical protein
MTLKGSVRSYASSNSHLQTQIGLLTQLRQSVALRVAQKMRELCMLSEDVQRQGAVIRFGETWTLPP